MVIKSILARVNGKTERELNYIDVFYRMQIEKLLMHYALTILIVEHDVKFKETLSTKLVKM